MRHVLFTTTAVSHWLEKTKTPRVLHVFDQVCNVVDEGRRVISLVTPEIGKGPFSLIVNLPHGRFTDFITPESEVSVDGIVLQIGSLSVDTNSAELWDARPLWESVPPSAIQAYLPLFESKLATSSRDSLWFVNGRSDPTSLKAQKAIITLQIGLKTGNLAACQEGARGLAGLGVGLTPAGDDFLLGVMVGLWLPKESSRGDAETQRIVEILVEEAVPRTTTLSGAWLEAAGRGEAGQPWHGLVEALRDEGETAVSQAIDHILTTGHTSGADALAGFVIAIKSKIKD